MKAGFDAVIERLDAMHQRVDRLNLQARIRDVENHLKR
jgi:hypothetical protein